VGKAGRVVSARKLSQFEQAVEALTAVVETARKRRGGDENAGKTDGPADKRAEERDIEVTVQGAEGLVSTVEKRAARW
jgi:hypothetical protein